MAHMLRVNVDFAACFNHDARNLNALTPIGVSTIQLSSVRPLLDLCTDMRMDMCTDMYVPLR